MGNLFGNIYYIFSGIFGQYLSDYLWGYNCETTTFDPPGAYLPIGLVMTVVTVLFVVLYYFILDRPKLDNILTWFAFLVSSAAINFFVGAVWVLRHLNNGYIGDCLRYIMNEEGDILAENITGYHCWMFGLANAIVSVVLFLLLSALLKRWSVSCRHTPWVSNWPKK